MILIVLWGLLPLATSLTEHEQNQFVPPDITERYSQAKPNVSIDKDLSTGKYSGLRITFNSIPGHYTGQWDGEGNNTQIREVKTEFLIHVNPFDATQTLWCLPFGIIGVTVGGVPIYNPFAAQPGCKFATAVTPLDACRGRTDENGRYHYYDYSPCAQTFTCNEPSEIYGVAIDGYPIYGPFDEDGNQLTNADLDECGGKIDTKGRYKYHIVVDKPNFMYCLKGEIHKHIGLDKNNFVCNCPYMDTHFEGEEKPMCPPPPPVKETEDGEETNNGDTDSANNGTEIDEKEKEKEMMDCLPAQTEEGEDIEYTEWGGRVITVPKICNFSSVYDMKLCSINETTFKSKSSWDYDRKTTALLPCCLNDTCTSCWVSITGNVLTNLNPECSVDERQIQYKTRVMVPNSAVRHGNFKTVALRTILLFLVGKLV